MHLYDFRSGRELTRKALMLQTTQRQWTARTTDVVTIAEEHMRSTTCEKTTWVPFQTPHFSHNKLWVPFQTPHFLSGKSKRFSHELIFICLSFYQQWKKGMAAIHSTIVIGQDGFIIFIKLGQHQQLERDNCIKPSDNNITLGHKGIETYRYQSKL